MIILKIWTLRRPFFISGKLESVESNKSKANYEMIRKKATQSNRKQQKATIDSNTEQHHNTIVKRQGTMSHPVAPDVPNT